MGAADALAVRPRLNAGRDEGTPGGGAAEVAGNAAAHLETGAIVAAEIYYGNRLAIRRANTLPTSEHAAKVPAMDRDSAEGTRVIWPKRHADLFISHQVGCEESIRTELLICVLDCEVDLSPAGLFRLRVYRHIRLCRDGGDSRRRLPTQQIGSEQQA